VKVGDLVKYGKDRTVGIVASYDGNNYYTIRFARYKLSYTTVDDIEVISEYKKEN
tara:strand:- start:439 stop:603 length:165 start_codon:yes stop_codon:yes gene_type:complete